MEKPACLGGQSFAVVIISATVIIFYLVFHIQTSDECTRRKSFQISSFRRQISPENKTFAHEYDTTVDLRIIVMAFDRPQSTLKSLESLNNLRTDGDLISLHIWIDVDTNGIANRDTVAIANNFQFLHGKKNVHIHSKNVGIFGNWVYTWRPKLNTRELALIVEDDLTISPYAWRWLKSVHSKYEDWDRVAGYSLQCEQRSFVGTRNPLPLRPNETVYGFRVIGTWGFAPHPRSWREFQDWVYSVKSDSFFKPYVDGIIPTDWYKGFEKRHFESSMWEMWHICYTHFNNLVTIFANFPRRQHKNISNELTLSGNCLAVCRGEKGLHSDGAQLLTESNIKSQLLLSWSKTFEVFPLKIRSFHYNGDAM